MIESTSPACFCCWDHGYVKDCGNGRIQGFDVTSLDGPWPVIPCPHPIHRREAAT